MAFRFVMLGDVVGMPGVNAVRQLMPMVRERYRPDLVIVNGENAASGSGLTPKLYEMLRTAGADGVTLGDHAFRKQQIFSTLETESTICRPANLPPAATGKAWMTLTPPNQRATPSPTLVVTTLLGRVFVELKANDPFATINAVLERVRRPGCGLTLVEIHAEATAEKIAMGWYLDGRVTAVVGTHTHVATADARILPKGTAYITDLGMCGPHESVLGRQVERVLKYMTTAMPAPFDVAEGDPRVNGVMIEADPVSGRALAIERFEFAADIRKPPFAAT